MLKNNITSPIGYSLRTASSSALDFEAILSAVFTPTAPSSAAFNSALTFEVEVFQCWITELMFDDIIKSFFHEYY
jgi:hypothetical protein